MGNVVKTEAKLIEVGRKNYAQYDNAPYVVFIPKGKRKPFVTRATSYPYLLVIEGHGHPEPADMLGEGKTENGVTIRQSTYSSFDEAYKTDFDAIINPYLTDKNVIVDVRQTVGKEVVNEFTDHN